MALLSILMDRLRSLMPGVFARIPNFGLFPASMGMTMDITSIVPEIWLMNLHFTVNGQVVQSGITATLEDREFEPSTDVKGPTNADSNGNLTWNDVNGYNRFPDQRHPYTIHAWYNQDGVDIFTGAWEVWLGHTYYCLIENGVTVCREGT